MEQLESAGGELQALCSLLQAELDLYTRYLSSQVQEEAQQATHTTAGASGEGGGGEEEERERRDAEGRKFGRREVEKGEGRDTEEEREKEGEVRGGIIKEKGETGREGC